MIYFWSDLHFNHSAVIEYCNRPFANVEAMNAALIETWNEIVYPHDTIWVLGDFAFSKSGLPTPADHFAKLAGHKCLIVGNHDEKNPAVLKLAWERVEKLHVVKEHGQKIVACHYPLESWPGAHHGVVHAHGHSHGTLKRVVPHRFDVGVDVRKAPVAFEELQWEAEQQEFSASDHHGEL